MITEKLGLMYMIDVAFFYPVKLNILAREQLRDLTKAYDKSENDLKALQSVGQVIVIIVYS